MIKNYVNLIPFLFFSTFYTNPVLSLAIDTISGNQTLSGNQTIVSSSGSFEFGFFNPGKSSKYYIGIWYRNISEKTVVWVANRETPILDPNSAQLKISGSGNLVLLNESRMNIWSTDLDSTGSDDAITVFAVLLDNGNFVLKEKPSASPTNSSIGETLWESFDHPTDTWLPGAKFGYNKRTHKKQVLTSWKNSEDPAPGLFSIELDMEITQYVIKWNKSVSFWKSGTWDNSSFEGIPEMRNTVKVKISFVNNNNESYFTYSLHDFSSLLSMIRIDVSGQIKALMWLNTTWISTWTKPKQQCEVYAYCSAFGICNQNPDPSCMCLQGFEPNFNEEWNLKDYSRGCLRETKLECQDSGVTSNATQDKFLTTPNVGLPSYPRSMVVRSKDECESTCLRDCSCNAYAYDENGCSIWNGELLNLRQLAQGDVSGKTIHIRYSKSSPLFRNLQNSKSKNTLFVGVISGSIATSLIILAIIWAIIWNRRRQKNRADGSLVPFSYKDLQVATRNFSVKLGGGSFGSVFKGTLPDSTTVAVKKLESFNQGEKQFKTEVSTIGIIQHVNLVRLLGFCPERNNKLLVYDFMENGSLDSHLFNSKGATTLNWKTRYGIALGIARGLAYLHENCRECIIHCDVKPENILLDANYTPKVGDFGLAKLMGHDFSRVLTTMRGTRGYLAPEWILGVPITAKADVYSYGMMLFELVSGNRNSEPLVDEKSTYFPCLVAGMVNEEGEILNLLDPTLDRNANAEEVSKICKVACWCIQDDENMRPSMGQVTQILEGFLDVSIPTIPRFLQLMLAAKDERMVFFTSSPSST